MTLRYRIEIRGVLPSGIPDELHRRFGAFTVHTDASRTILSDLTLDQAALRALLGLLWEVDSELGLVSAMDDGAAKEHRSDGLRGERS